MFDNDDFIAWANENCVVAVGHDGATGGKEDHKPAKEKDPKTKEEKEVCPSYVGLTCAEHQKIRRDAENPPEGWDKMFESNGVPKNAWFSPEGRITKLENKDALAAKTLMDILTAAQGKSKAIPFKKWDAYNKAFEDCDKAAADGKWKAALAALQKVDADGKKLTKPLQDKVAAKAKDVNEKVVARFDEIRNGEGDDATKLKAAKALRAEVGTKLSTGALPVVADLDTWIKEASAPATPPK